MNVSNPDWQSAHLDPISFSLIPVGFQEPIGQGWTEEAYTIPPHGSSIVVLFLKIQDSPILSNFLEHYMTMGRSELTISGFMRSTLLITWKIPLSLHYVLENKTRAFEVIAGLTTIEAVPPGTRFNITITLTNPTAIPLNISRLTFTAYNESSHILRGVLVSPVKIPPLDSINTSAIIDVEKAGFEWILGRMISNNTSKMGIDGRVSAELYGLNPTFNYSRPFELSPLSWGLQRNKTQPFSELLDSITRGPDHVTFEVPYEITSPIDCNLSSINFELYDKTSYVGFGHTSFAGPLLLTANQRMQVPISLNLTLPAFNRMVVRFLLGEDFDLELKHGLISISIYQTEYNIHFERRLKF